MDAWGKSDADGTPIKIWNANGGDNQQWAFFDNGDGTFVIRSAHSGKCLDSDNDYLPPSPTAEYPDVFQWTCNGDASQSWYVEKGNSSPNDHSSWVIRHASDDRCMTATGAWGPGGKIDARVSLFRCQPVSGPNATLGVWQTVNGSSDSSLTFSDHEAALNNLATTYALKQCSVNSSVITSCTYQVDTDEPATAKNTKKVSPYVWNATTSTADQTVTWTQATSQSNSVGGSVTVSTEVGFNVDVVSAKISTAINAHYDHSWVETNTLSNAVKITIRPGTYGWVMRGQLMKTVHGTWTMTDDRGITWSGKGSATVPAEEGTDDATSSIILCTSDSGVKVCKDSAM